jgi:hypothetical protein
MILNVLSGHPGENCHALRSLIFVHGASHAFNDCLFDLPVGSYQPDGFFVPYS